MAYEFIKLNETPIAENATDANLLIESGGDIKRISAESLQSQSGGGVNIVTYYAGGSAGLIHSDGTRVSCKDMVDEWEKGNIIRIEADGLARKVLDMAYYMDDGIVNSVQYYYIWGDTGITFGTQTD